MKSAMKKLTAGLLSAGMVLTMMQPVLTGSAVETEAISEEAFRELVHTAWENKATTIPLSSYRLTLDQVASMYYDILYTEAEWFYVNSGFSYSTTASRRYIATLEVEYNYDLSQVDDMQKELDAAVEEILSGVQSGWSDAEKVLYLHEYLAEHCEYDLNYEKYDAYAAILGGTAVCQGYSLAMCMLCRELGIPCYTITSDTLDHMWNVVQIDGKWYHCDVTYDDGAPDMLGHATHQYLLVSDEYMQADPNHAADDWNIFSGGKTITCTDDTYSDACWTFVMDTMHPLPDGTWYYAEAADPSQVRYASDVKAILKRGGILGSQEAIRTIRAGWDTHRNTVYSICYVTSQIYDGNVYYHDPTAIYKMPLDSTTPTRIYTLTDEEKELGEIYGMRIDKDGVLTYQIMAAPAFPSEEELHLDVTFHTIRLNEEQPEESAVTTTETTGTTTTTATTVTTTAATTTATTTAAATTKTTSTTTAATTTATTTSATTTVTTTATTLPTTVTFRTTTTPATTVPTIPTVTHTTSTTRRTGRTTTTPTATTVTEPVTTEETVTTVTEPTAAETTTVSVTASAPETSTETTTSTTAQPVSMLRGDVNSDGVVDVSDAVLLARLVAEDPTAYISTQGLLNADCTYDGKRNHEDVLWILRFIARLL